MVGRWGGEGWEGKGWEGDSCYCYRIMEPSLTNLCGFQSQM